MSDQVSDALDSVTATAAPPDGVSAALDSVGTQTPVAATTAPNTPWWQKVIGFPAAYDQEVAHAATGMAGQVAGGLVGLGSLPFVGAERSAGLVKSVSNALTYEPRGAEGQAVSRFYGDISGSKWNPLNWPDIAGGKAGDFAASHGAPPLVSTGLRIAPDAAAMLWGLRSVPEAKKGSIIKEGVRPGDVPEPLEVAPGEPRGAPSTVGEGEAPHAAFEEPPEAAPHSQLPPPEQARRIRVLNELGLNGQDIRASAISGDPLAASTDAQLAKLDTGSGRVAKAALDTERNALRSYGQQTAELTGGHLGDTQIDTISRGQSVTDALEGLSDHYNAGIRSLYQAADEAGKGVPTDLKGFQDVLKDDSLMTNQDRIGLRGGLNAYLNKLGVVDKNGNITASVQQAETIRKYLNDEWSPQNSKLVRSLKDALDDDVTSSAGSDIYGQARALRAQRGQTLDDPKGISSLIDSSGPNGINRIVPSDKVMQKIETMPPEQLDHVLTTLRGMTGDLAPQGQKALSDIQSHFAQRLNEIGDSQQVQWNSKGVNQYLKNNAARLQSVFADKPDLLKRFYTLNEGGKILRFDPSYPGAAAQAANLAKSGAFPTYLHRGISTGAAAAGGAFGGPIGAAAGEFVGNIAGGKAAQAAAERAALKAAKGRTVRLGDIP